ncbi:MAG: hypothetical protein KA165_14610 [Saprospiraceae bacterium]|nr:hypothetical protein [Saprospiraceae bacterium]
MKKHFIHLLLPVILWSGCKDDPEQIPAYLELQPFAVNAQGGASWQKITDGWLYVNGEFLGAYTLPATVPILAEGESEVILFPGVKENGISATPNIYPFLKRYEVQHVLTPAQTTTVSPVTEYEANVEFPWESRGEFDSGSTLQFENRDGDNNTGYSLSTDGAFSGKSVLMEVDTSHWLIEIASEKASQLPVTGEKQVWLEMNYKNDMPFTLYLLGTKGTSNELAQVVYQFNNSENWNKIYLNLTEFLTATAQEDYRLFFRTTLPRNESNKFTQNSGRVMLDNIRLVHF